MALINTRREIRELTINQVSEILRKAYLENKLGRDDDGAYLVTSTPALICSWRYFGHPHRPDCIYWHKFITTPGLGKGSSFIPIACQNCYKVVVKPRTVEELFKLADILEELGRPSKCGSERRDTTFGLYGGYLYHENVEAALATEEEVWGLVSEKIAAGIPIFTKRGCTEYELAHGDSRQWHPYPSQEDVETWIRDHFHIYLKGSQVQSEEGIAMIQGEWLKWAYAHGDATYLIYTGQPLYDPYTIYTKGGN